MKKTDTSSVRWTTPLSIFLPSFCTLSNYIYKTKKQNK